MEADRRPTSPPANHPITGDRAPNRSRRLALAVFSLTLILSTSTLLGLAPSVAAAPTGGGAQVAGSWTDALRGYIDHVAHVAQISAQETVSAYTEPQTQVVRLRPRPKPGRFSMNLYRDGDFVSQQTEYWCVAASLQTMMNIIDDGKPKRSAKRQKQLHFQARRLHGEGDGFWRKLAGPARWKRGLHGLGLEDWADTLETSGYGDYEIDRAPTMKRAIRMAAKAIRVTGRPAGLVVWRGAHAWVMSGFQATGDPAYTNDFKVEKAIIQDPWYPRVSSIWGASRPPNSAVTMKQLSEDFLRYKRPARRQPMRDGKYMLILPVLPPDTKVR